MKKIINTSLILVMFAILNLFQHQHLYAQTPGSLDLSFDTDGKVTTDFANSNDYGNSVVIQPDGKIVVAGYSDNGTISDFALARYNNDGSLDNTFDSDGKVTTDFGGSNDFSTSVGIQLDGKIIVVGYSDNGTGNDFALARYNSNGSLDTTFDSDGKLTTDFASFDDYGNSIVIQPDGKIVVAGYSLNGFDNDFAMVRYNSNGSLDISFDTDGKQTTDFAGLTDNAASVVLQSDGKIILAGSSSNGFASDFALVRYNSNGGLDTSFDDDGKLTTAIGSLADYGGSVVLQSDGKILAAGSSDNSADYDFALVRYYSNGSLDNTFDSDGKLTTDFGSTFDNASSVVLQSDGKILVAGYSAFSFIFDFALVRYNSDGSLDTSFSGDGKLTTSFASSNDQGYSAAIQPDGKIIVAGYSTNVSDFDFAVARYISGLNMGIIDFSLDNNSVLIYPNPIAQDSKLEYILNTKENISISLFDMQGKMVKTFVNNETQELGNHTQTLALPEDMASGSYFIIISTPSAKVSVKIIK